MNESHSKKPKEPMVAVSCTQCAIKFSVSSGALEASRSLSCPACKRKFIPIFTEGTNRDSRKK